jgi:hypothetical protein|tara:strand:+ start:77 stop:292 length:216 start_codon:yes stop_codon:yes gene_type:complete
VQLKVGKKSKVVKEAEQQVANLKTSIDMMANIIELAAIDDKHALELQSWIKEYTLDIELLDAQITEVATHE